jgi:AcrR family transcriptional regulator
MRFELVTEKESGRGRGRPRCEDARKKILNAAMRLLQERSFSEITIDAIADEAGAGKATIYRWWQNKAAVLIEAFREAVAAELPFPQTGVLEEDLRLYLRQFAQLVRGKRGRIFSGMIAAAQRDPQVAEAFREMWIKPRRAGTKAVLERHREAGELSPDVDLDCVIEVLFGPLYYRLLFSWGRLDEAYLEQLLQTALVGIRKR